MIDAQVKFSRPGEQRAFHLGRVAHRAGRQMNDNPYTHETSVQSANNRAWRAGWSAEAGGAAAKRAMAAAEVAMG